MGEISKPYDQIIADICAAPETKLTPELRDRLEAVPEELHDQFSDQIWHEVVRWLEYHASQSADYEAGFRTAVHQLVFIAAYALRAMKRRLGNEISPANSLRIATAKPKAY